MDPQDMTPVKALQTARALWFGLTSGLFIVAGFIFFVMADGREPDPSRTLLAIAWIVVVVGMMAGHGLRQQIYKRNWVEHAITPQGYSFGNLVYYICMDVAATVSVVLYILTVDPLVLASVALPLLLMLLNFPNGKAMMQHPNPWLRDGLDTQPRSHDDH